APMSSNSHQHSDRLNFADLSTEEKSSLATELVHTDSWQATHRSLSLAQQRLWVVNAFNSGSPVYNICIAYRLSGSLDTECFERALRALFDRHKTLRTSFGMV